MEKIEYRLLDKVFRAGKRISKEIYSHFDKQDLIRIQ
jgi:hypothetical protein